MNGHVRLSAFLWAGAVTGLTGVILNAVTDQDAWGIAGGALLTGTLVPLAVRDAITWGMRHVSILPAARALRMGRETDARVKRNTARLDGLEEYIGTRIGDLTERVNDAYHGFEEACRINGITVPPAADAKTMPDLKLRVIDGEAG